MISIKNVYKLYNTGTNQISAIDDISLSITKGEFVVILGASGSGKTTLLNVLSTLDNPTTGDIEIDGINLPDLNRKKKFHFRREKIGFIFQSFNLFPTLSALENVEFVANLAELDNPKELAIAALDKVGLKDRIRHFPHQLSGGEQQRVAIARALVKNSPIIFADEPTGELDYNTGKQILKLLQEQKNMGKTILLVTHNREISKMADRVIELHSGKIARDGPPFGGKADVDDLIW